MRRRRAVLFPTNVQDTLVEADLIPTKVERAGQAAGLEIKVRLFILWLMSVTEGTDARGARPRGPRRAIAKGCPNRLMGKRSEV
jgi:hypothetical protein